MMLGIRTVGLDRVINFLAGMQTRTRNFEKPLKVISNRMFREVIEHFDREQGPHGRWARLKPSTIARRRRGSSKPLQDTGNLRNSILPKVMNRNSAIVFTNVKYATTHQFGTRKGAFGRDRHNRPIPWGDIPARPYMWVSAESRRSFINYLEDWIIRGRG
ncbi:MAG: phage virion morphogenesis protein [Candidatus Heimdallarchaeaceae archaeon]